ncbi:MAG: MFS transporter, partial [Candidatus Coatesbacteria bacterium]|nr:MFS transporter [Candidatus Coatesbacteria bacterium]
GVIFALPPIALILTAHTWTRFGERWGYHRGIQIGLVGAGLCGLALVFAHSIWVFAAVFFITGIFLASLNPSTGAIICTKVDPAFRGRAYGMQSSATMFGHLIAPLAATWIAAEFGLPSVFIFIGISALAGSLAFFMLVNGKQK